MSKLSLTGRSAVVTGAASGIGFAIAKRFAEQGATVHMLDLNAGKLQEAADLILQAGHTAYPHICDVSLASSVLPVFRNLSGPTDILVNSAGIAHIGNVCSTTPEDMDRLYSVNVRGTYLCMRAAIEGMLAAKRGCILNIASIAATRGISDRFAYSMTKGAVLSMTLSVAKDYITQGIRCNCLSPARVHTPFVDGFLAKNYPGRESEKMKALSESQPIGRMGTPDEVAALAHFLCSDEAAFLTGADFPLDGGYFNLR